MSYSSTGWGYDAYNYNSDFAYEDEKNYTKPVKEKTFQDRVNEKRNSLNANLSNASNAVKMDKVSEPCNCVECAPELYKKNPTNDPQKKDEKQTSENQSPTKPMENNHSNVFYIGINKDTIFTFIILILCILSFVMYYKIKKLAKQLKFMQFYKQTAMPMPVNV